MVQRGGGLGGAKVDKTLVAGALDHALGSLAGGGVDICGHDARLALACCRLALARSASSCSHRAASCSCQPSKPQCLACGAGAAVGQNVHGFQQQAAAGARGID